MSWRSTTLNISILQLFCYWHCAVFQYYATYLWGQFGLLLHNFTISTAFLSQKTAAICYLKDICFNFFSLFGECVCIQCTDCSSVSTFTDETQASSPVTVWLRNLPSLWYHSKKKNQSWSRSLCIVCACEHFWNKQKKNSMALIPWANYTDLATATCRRNLVPTFVDRGVSCGQRGGSPTVVNLSFLDRFLKPILWKFT
jgi:hypothetical protein